MDEKIFFFVISIPRDELIEYSTKLSSYISRFFPGKINPFTLKPLEILDNNAIIKIIIPSGEAEIREFADRFFGASYDLREHDNGEVEIVRMGHSQDPAPSPKTHIRH